ncbi:MAG: hypothetical protein ACREBG_29010, partial [Pyrinomonadaceae bacterium]
MPGIKLRICANFNLAGILDKKPGAIVFQMTHFPNLAVKSLGSTCFVVAIALLLCGGWAVSYGQESDEVVRTNV